MASGTGLLDQRTCTWDAELVRGIEDRLPPIDDTPRSGLVREWAERWPGLRDVPWFPAWGGGPARTSAAAARRSSGRR